MREPQAIGRKPSVRAASKDMKFTKFCAEHDAMIVQKANMVGWFAQKWAKAQVAQVVAKVLLRPRSRAGED